MRDEFSDENYIIRRMQDEKDELKARIEKLEKLVEELLEEGHYLAMLNELEPVDYLDWRVLARRAERMLAK